MKLAIGFCKYDDCGGRLIYDMANHQVTCEECLRVKYVDANESLKDFDLRIPYFIG
jgi:hypothetical protein